MVNFEEFERIYHECFDEDNHIKICGRDKCKQLLRLLNDEKYGNLETGYLNIPEVVGFYLSENTKHSTVS